MVSAAKMQTYNFGDYSFFTVRNAYTGDFKVHVYKEVENKYGLIDEKFITEIPGMTSSKIAKMSDKELDVLIKEIEYENK